jgi:parallel beta-helix repeat protein
VPLFDDKTKESAESMTVTLTADGAGTVAAPSVHTLTIADDDTSAALSAADAVPVTEGHTGTTTASFAVTLAGTPAGTVTVAYQTVDGTAVAGSDYTAVSGTLTFPAGVTSRLVNVTVLADTTDEADEAFGLVLSSPTGAILDRGTAQAAILDDDGTTSVCTPILSVPFTIEAAGNYCLVKNLSTSITSGAAITVNADYVRIEMNGFKIGGGGAGPGTQAIGIYAHQRKDVTVRNGNIRGFYVGILMDDAPVYSGSRKHLVERIRADENTYVGIWLEGTGSTVRNSHVVATGGTTVNGPDSPVYGIFVQGPGSRVLDNDVMGSTPVGNETGYGLYLNSSPAAVVGGNRITGPGGYGIYLGGSTDLAVKNNRLTGLEDGIVFGATSTGHYRDSLTSGVTRPYTGGQNAGNNQ